MEKFYFTYGSEGMDFRGGWTVVEAEDMKTAAVIFRAFHPDKTPKVLNCAAIYTEAQFLHTGMPDTGNLGAYCHEAITLQHELFDKKDDATRMVGLVVTTKNEIYQLGYDAPRYDVIREVVGGWYEHVRPKGLQSPYCMMVNEEGLLIGLPINPLGSYLYGTQTHGQPITGDVIFLKEGYYNGERDMVGMTADEAQDLGNRFIAMSNGAVRWTKNEKEST